MSRISVSAAEQLAELKVGAEEVISEHELLAKLERSYREQKPLIVKLGADPSRPDIHLGHTVVLNKLRLLQEFGHDVVFVIGDFTALIGDPTGKSKTRPQLERSEIAANAATYKDQVFKILDPDKTRVVFNSSWIDPLKPWDLIKLLATRTVQQLIAREDFSTRYEGGSPIYLHEFAYPLLQAYDSLVLKADIELGGTDQKFNLLLGRELQRQKGQEPQCLILSPLLAGLDGVQKMSKSLDNYISLTDSPTDMFGKTMSISDSHMLTFYELLSRKGEAYIADVKKRLAAGSLHPMDAKKDIGEELVSQFWGAENGRKARDNFTSQFSQKALPTDLATHSLTLPADGLVDILALSVALNFSKSKSEARRILQQQGLRLDEQTLSDEKLRLVPGSTYIFKQGKLKIVKLIVLPH